MIEHANNGSKLIAGEALGNSITSKLGLCCFGIFDFSKEKLELKKCHYFWAINDTKSAEK